MQNLYSEEEIKKQIEKWDKKIFGEDVDEIKEAYRKKLNSQ